MRLSGHKPNILFIVFLGNAPYFAFILNGVQIYVFDKSKINKLTIEDMDEIANKAKIVKPLITSGKLILYFSTIEKITTENISKDHSTSFNKVDVYKTIEL